jgi:peptidylprolyl isomerase
MMKNISILTLSALLLLGYDAVAQKKAKPKDKSPMMAETTPTEITTSSGLKVKIVHKGTGNRPQIGDKVTVHYTGTLTDNTKFDSSRDRDQPFSFKLGMGQVIKGWDEGIAMLNVGDKAILTIPADLGYGDRNMGNIPPNSVLVFDVELLSVQEGVRPYNTEGKDTITTASGLQYILVEKVAESQKAEEGSSVTVHYTGYLLDGKIFDSSVERDQPAKFTIGGGRLIKGWEEGVSYMRVGEKARLIIPPHLAYGEQGAGGVIPPNATLIFDIELVSVKEGAKPFDVSGKDTLKTSSGLKYIVVSRAPNDAKQAQPGKTVKVHYTGYLTTGKMFDSSLDRGQPIDFMLGTGRVIKGWEEGVALMKQGDKMRLIIPSELGYGDQGVGGVIPPNATLIFDVELVEVMD